MIKKFKGKQYKVPSGLELRFDYLREKIEYAEKVPEYIEMYRGYSIVFDCEFRDYLIKE